MLKKHNFKLWLKYFEIISYQVQNLAKESFVQQIMEENKNIPKNKDYLMTLTYQHLYLVLSERKNAQEIHFEEKMFKQKEKLYYFLNIN